MDQGRAVCHMGFPGLLSTWSLRYTPQPHLTSLLIGAPEVQVFFQSETFKFTSSIFHGPNKNLSRNIST